MYPNGYQPIAMVRLELLRTNYSTLIVVNGNVWTAEYDMSDKFRVFHVCEVSSYVNEIVMHELVQGSRKRGGQWPY